MKALTLEKQNKNSNALPKTLRTINVRIQLDTVQ